MEHFVKQGFGQQVVLHVVRQMQRFVQPGQAVFKFSVLNLAQVIFF